MIFFNFLSYIIKNVKYLNIDFKNFRIFEGFLDKLNLDTVHVLNLNLYKTVLNKSNFFYSIINNIRITSSKIVKCNFKITVFKDINLVNSDVIDCDFINSTIINSNLNTSRFVNVSFKGTTFKASNLIDSVFTYCDFTNCDFQKCYLTKVNFEQCIIPWRSHEIISEILLRSARHDIEKIKIAGLISIKTDWCWKEFANINCTKEQKDWAMSTLSQWAWEDDPSVNIYVLNWMEDNGVKRPVRKLNPLENE